MQSELTMKKALANKIFSILFLGIFFIKMVICVAPIIVAHFDKKSVNDVIMQLEIEHSAKESETKQVSVKEYLSIISYAVYSPNHVLIMQAELISANHAKHARSFYPSVPTPPPNI